jgi:hypothetical protein
VAVYVCVNTSHRFLPARVNHCSAIAEHAPLPLGARQVDVHPPAQARAPDHARAVRREHRVRVAAPAPGGVVAAQLDHHCPAPVVVLADQRYVAPVFPIRLADLRRVTTTIAPDGACQASAQIHRAVGPTLRPDCCCPVRSQREGREHEHVVTRTLGPLDPPTMQPNSRGHALVQKGRKAWDRPAEVTRRTHPLPPRGAPRVQAPGHLSRGPVRHLSRGVGARGDQCVYRLRLTV